jgi:hypothetical protein
VNTVDRSITFTKLFNFLIACTYLPDHWRRIPHFISQRYDQRPDFHSNLNNATEIFTRNSAKRGLIFITENLTRPSSTLVPKSFLTREPYSSQSTVLFQMKRFRTEENYARPSKKSNQGGSGTDNIRTRIKQIQSFYEELAIAEKEAVYRWLPEKRAKNPGKSPKRTPSTAIPTGPRRSLERDPRRPPSETSQLSAVGTTAGRDHGKAPITVRVNIPIAGVGTPPDKAIFHRLVRLENPPRIPLLACPWSWSDYRLNRDFRNTPSMSNPAKTKSDGSGLEFLTEWNQLEFIGDRMISLILGKILKRLNLPHSVAAYFHGNLIRDELWRE